MQYLFNLSLFVLSTLSGLQFELQTTQHCPSEVVHYLVEIVNHSFEIIDTISIVLTNPIKGEEFDFIPPVFVPD